ncbi:MAG TPA: TlpA disulfide reductase family protein [Thermodesulfobacteriota bacterium]|nr:TlpA disulfide reductase family protein [Thermodesulfobacteriota bacterium]
MKRSFAIWLVVFSFCVGSVFLFSRCSTGEKEPSLDLAPDFSLKSFDGQEVTLSQLKGKIVLLDFWATWCEPCRESIPHLIQLYKSYKESGFEVVGMNVDKGDREAVRRFITSMDIPYPVVTVPEDVARNYRVTGIPAAFLIDKEGKIRERFVGFSGAIAQQLTSKVATLTSPKP